MCTLHFKFEQMDMAPLSVKQSTTGHDLLEIALANGIDLHHQCGGVGHCTGCHVYIEEGNGLLSSKEKQEDLFIQKSINTRPQSRMACQAVLKKLSGDITILVPDQRCFEAGVLR